MVDHYCFFCHKYKPSVRRLIQAESFIYICKDCGNELKEKLEIEWTTAELLAILRAQYPNEAVP